MRRIWLAVTTALLLAACAPSTLSPNIEREGDALTVTVLANEAVYNVTLHVLNATTSDERCGPIGPDIACVLGDLAAGEAATVSATAVVSGTSEESYCVAFGFSDPEGSITSYRPYECSVGSG